MLCIFFQILKKLLRSYLYESLKIPMLTELIRSHKSMSKTKRKKKIEQHEFHENPRCPGRDSSSYSTSDTRHETVKRYEHGVGYQSR